MDFKISDELLHYSIFGRNRKDQHVMLASQQYSRESAPDFEETRFVHHSLPQLKVQDVDYSTSVAGLDLQTPFFINAMTGGTEETGRINRVLGILGFLAKIPVASGSVSAAIKDPSVAETFSVIRRENPKGIVFANLGAHHDVENAKRAVDLLEANALQIHVNAPQEILMPEGDRDFSNWLTNIETLVREIEVPVIVKEVGFGMSRETVKQLASVGIWLKWACSTACSTRWMNSRCLTICLMKCSPTQPKRWCKKATRRIRKQTATLLSPLAAAAQLIPPKR